jgi:hypothetical protein
VAEVSKKVESVLSSIQRGAPGEVDLPGSADGKQGGRPTRAGEAGQPS